jgi:hypothetical protein
MTHYKEATTIDPAFTEGYIGMAEVEALQRHYDKARGYINEAIAHTSQPAQKLVYMRDIGGTYAMANDRKGVQTQLTAIANEAKAQGDARTAAIAYSQLAATAANNGDAKAAHGYLDMARSTYAQPSAPIAYYAAMTHGLLKHWDPAKAAIAAAKAAPDATPLANRIAAAEAYLATAQGKPADGVALLTSADLTDPLVAGRLAEAYVAAGRAADASKLQQQITSNYVLNLSDWPAVNARARAQAAMLASTKGSKK